MYESSVIAIYPALSTTGGEQLATNWFFPSNFTEIKLLRPDIKVSEFKQTSATSVSVSCLCTVCIQCHTSYIHVTVLVFIKYTNSVPCAYSLSWPLQLWLHLCISKQHSLETLSE